MQEPASTIFSILNGIAAVFMLIQFRKRVPPKAPMYEAWHGYFAVSICLFSFFSSAMKWKIARLVSLGNIDLFYSRYIADIRYNRD